MKKGDNSHISSEYVPPFLLNFQVRQNSQKPMRFLKF